MAKTPEGETETSPESAEKLSEKRRRVRRAQGARASNTRSASGRRPIVDPVIADRGYTEAALEFVAAMNEYKRRSGKMFPTWSDVLEVLRGLGYEKVAAGKTDERKGSALLDRLEPSRSPVGADRSKMLKEESMPASASEGVDQRARSTALHKLLIGVVDNPESWLSTPSIHFGGRRPLDLVGTDEEYKLTDLLQAVDQGLF